VAMARHLPHAATAYALLAHGLGRSWGVAGAAVALVAYNSIQICLYGLLGAVLSGLAGGEWWVWAALAWLIIALLGVRNVHLNTGVLTVALMIEIGVIVLLDLTAFTHPAAGSVSLAPLTTHALFVDGVGGVFALGIAAFVGYESGPVFSEEARSHKTVARATFATLVFLGVFYAVSSWALAIAVGPNHVVDVARDPSAGLPFSILADAYGDIMAGVATALLVTSVLAAMISFHNSVARYLFALGRERVLPFRFARLNPRTGAPTGGSVVQSALAAAVVAGFVLARADPMAVLFTWLSTVGAIGVLLVLVAASWAALRYFRAGGGTNEGVWTRRIAPTLGVLAGVAVLGIMVGNVESLLGVPPRSALTFVLPGIVVLAAIMGLGWGLSLRRRRPEVYEGIGRGRPHPLAVMDHRLAQVEV